MTDSTKRGPLLKSFEVAFRGIGEAWSRERNFRIQVLYAVVIAGLLLWLRPDRLEALLLGLALAALLSAELMNTALERAVDLVTQTHHPLARSAKDIAAGAVLVVAIGAALLSLLVFAPLLPWSSWLPLAAFHGLTLSLRFRWGLGR